jgi:hypothetical protein
MQASGSYLFATCGTSALTSLDDLNAAAAAVEMHVAVDQGVQREIASLTHPLTGVESSAHLADENVPGSHGFSAESLHAATLGVRVTSVSAGTLSLLMCHKITSPRESSADKRIVSNLAMPPLNNAENVWGLDPSLRSG